jgi:hypothetical protein
LQSIRGSRVKTTVLKDVALNFIIILDVPQI